MKILCLPVLLMLMLPILSYSQNADTSATSQERKFIEATGTIIIKPNSSKYSDEGGAALNYGAGLVYPKEALQKGKQGKVVVRFLMNSDGTVSDIELLEEGPPLLNEAVLELVRKMPDRLKKGMNTRYTVTITFRLE